MMYKACSRIAACAAVFLLSACGGGGGGGGSLASIPPPPPPPPTEASYDSFPLTDSATFDTIKADRVTQIDAATGRPFVASTDTSGLGSELKFTYDASSGTYSLANPNYSATFSSDAGSSAGSSLNFETQSATASDQLTLFKNVTTSSYSGLQLSYLSFGTWSHTDTTTGASQLTYFLFGFPTTNSDMPRSGKATYQTAVSANEYLVSDRHPTGPADLNGSATFSADFATGAIDTELTLNRADDSTSVGVFTGTGSISANQFSGTFSSADPLFVSGAFEGGFFGPAAKEMGYTFDIRLNDPDPYAGAALPEVIDAWIMGSVVGTKDSN